MCFFLKSCVFCCLFQRSVRNKQPAPLTDEDYNRIYKILSKELPRKHWHKHDMSLYRKICRHHLQLEKVYDPLFRERVERIVTGSGKIVPRISEVAQIIDILRKDSIGEGAKKCAHRALEYYAGIGEKIIQKHINHSKESTELHPRFTNKPPLQPIEATTPMAMVEADLVDMAKYAETRGGKTYRYVLSILDVFSRYVMCVASIQWRHHL